MARTHVVMPDDLIKAIDKVAGGRGRSHFLEEAAREKLARLELAQTLRGTAGIARGSGYGHWANRGSAATWVQQTRRTESSA